MALTLTQAELSAAIRLGDSAEEVAEATRLLAFVIEAISRHLGAAYEDAPEVIVNEAGIRLAGYLFDQPNAGRGVSFANAGRNSGAWTILLPYRLHRAGSTSEAVEAAQQAIGTTGNPVTGLAITVSGKLEVIFADGATVELDLPAGMGGGVLDQTARDSAAAAQTAADSATTAAAAAQSDIDAHEANHPSGGAGVDQTARDAAAAAQSEIDAHEASTHNTDAGARTAAANAQSAIEDHERTTHNTDTTARDAAAAAQGTANNAATAATAAAATANANTGRLDAFPAGTGGVDQTARDAADGAQGTADAAQADLDTHEGTPHNTDGTARAAAATAQAAADAAQADLDTHERAPHNTDGTARTAASAAHTRADDAFALADEKVDSSGAASAAREVVVDWAESDNQEPIPAPKLVNVVNAHEDIVNVLDGRLPGLPVPMRLGWSQRADFLAADFARPSPPIGGSIAGMSDGLAAPPFPPGLASDPTLFLGIWLAGDPDVVAISGGGAQFGDARPLTLEGGKVGGTPGVYLVSTARLRPLEGTIFSVTITGPRIVTESDLAAHAGDPDAHHVPPTGSMGGGPTVLYEATAAIGTSTGLIAGNLACPETGDLEFYFQGLTGTRQGGVAYARMPVARIRGAVSALDVAYSNDSATLLAIPHGANRGVGIAVQTETNYLMLSAQAPGDFYIRVAHTV